MYEINNEVLPWSNVQIVQENCQSLRRNGSMADILLSFILARVEQILGVTRLQEQKLSN